LFRYRNAEGGTARAKAFAPSTGALWTVVNERDEIGDDVPPDYVASAKEGGLCLALFTRRPAD
jgi:glucose/arabinose dehydrogenase